jgi:hypothetical protein
MQPSARRSKRRYASATSARGSRWVDGGRCKPGAADPRHHEPGSRGVGADHDSLASRLRGRSSERGATPLAVTTGILLGVGAVGALGDTLLVFGPGWIVLAMLLLALGWRLARRRRRPSPPPGRVRRQRRRGQPGGIAAFFSAMIVLAYRSR